MGSNSENQLSLVIEYTKKKIRMWWNECVSSQSERIQQSQRVMNTKEVSGSKYKI